MGLFLIIVSPINIVFPHREFGLKQDAIVRLMITHNNNWNSCLDFVLVSKARQLCLPKFYNP